MIKDLNDDLLVFSQYDSMVTVTKYTPQGNVQWSKNIISGPAKLNAYKVDANNKLVMVGDATGHCTAGNFTLSPNGSKGFFLITMDVNSNITQAGIFGGVSEASASDIFINKSGDYVICGNYRDSFVMNGTTITGDSNLNCYLLKLSPGGQVLWWEKSTLESGNEFSTFEEVVESEKGNYYVKVAMVSTLVNWKGYKFPYSGWYLMKLDSMRNTLWTDYLGHPEMSFGSVKDIQEHNDTVYMKEYVSYVHGPNGSRLRLWNPLGTGKKHIDFSGTSIGYQVSGHKVYLACPIANEQTSDYRWMKIYNSDLTAATSAVDSTHFTSNHPTEYFDVQVIDASTFYLSATQDDLGFTFVAKYDFNLPVSVEENFMTDLISFYPNPARENLFINCRNKFVKTIQIMGVTGARLHSERINNVVTSHSVDLSRFSNGAYFLVLDLPEGRVTKKFIIR
jgi:hypothetical protein